MSVTLSKGMFTALKLLAHRPQGLHGAALIREIKTVTGRQWSVGALYTTMERLQDKGFVSSTWGEPTPERGGRRKRIFRIEASGRQAIHATEAYYSSAFPLGARLSEV
jgi:PadR family transcriptional regulator PadR